MDTQIFIPFSSSPPNIAAKMSDPKERFFRYFQAEITAIQGQIDDLATLSPVGGERQDCTDTVLAGISRLSNEVMDAADYIPAYDQRTYSQAVKALTEKLNETTAKFAPKSRFQFKPRAVAKSEAEQRPDLRRRRGPLGNSADLSGRSAVAAGSDVGGDPVQPAKDYNQEIERPDELGTGIRKPSFSAVESVALRDHTGLHIMLPPAAAGAASSGNLTNLSRCVVDMPAPTIGDSSSGSGAPFASLALKNIRQSLVVTGRVAGPVHVTGLRDCVVVVAARQLRFHECIGVDVYLHCASHPIIEDCSRMRFAPLPEFYATKLGTTDESNQWDQVDDFKWLKSEPSPNWTVLPEGERVAADVWQDAVRGGPSRSTDDILRTVGVPSS
ncbi:TBCC-domain-containing protein [Durotheca rogersii]|uniref:TBCC-domain-containing protein n=1 Tax=Durotheca rogersii TaxID=419775 RepID=UPI00221EE492|nr:TBCC-domain-containing protein [Durotheca rogersii]KAI5859890.1 TBCC-domain-containing protein [Durotheca rogersii]